MTADKCWSISKEDWERATNEQRGWFLYESTNNLALRLGQYERQLAGYEKKLELYEQRRWTIDLCSFLWGAGGGVLITVIIQVFGLVPTIKACAQAVRLIF